MKQLLPGTGSAPAHHGEILQGVFHDDAGRLKRALVTLPTPQFESSATFHPCPWRCDITCQPGMSKACRAATLSMAAFATERSPAVGGRIEVSSTVPRGIGMGSSTADVTAVIRAIADFHGATPSAEKIARLAVRAEGASDPVMIGSRVVLFAQREGLVLETFGRGMPSMVVVGCDASPGSGGIDTMRLAPAAYTEADIDAFGLLRAELRAALVTADVTRLGKVATASALIAQRSLPKAALEFLLDVCRSCGGAGIQVAHSGTVAGIIFDPWRDGAAKGIARCIDRLEKAGLPLTGVIGALPTMAGGVLPGRSRR